MIKQIDLELNSDRLFTEIEIGTPNAARRLLNEHGTDTAIVVVVNKHNKGTAEFIAYNSNFELRAIGRRVDNIDMEVLQGSGKNYFEKILDLPKTRYELSFTWQIIDGWWNDYFGTYAREQGRQYYLATKRKNVSKKKYLVSKDLKVR